MIRDSREQAVDFTTVQFTKLPIIIIVRRAASRLILNTYSEFTSYMRQQPNTYFVCIHTHTHRLHTHLLPSVKFKSQPNMTIQHVECAARHAHATKTKRIKPQQYIQNEIGAEKLVSMIALNRCRLIQNNSILYCPYAVVAGRARALTPSVSFERPQPRIYWTDPDHVNSGE